MITIENVKFDSQKKLSDLTSKTNDSFRTNKHINPEFLKNVCIYACGSLGRLEVTENSDLDLFFLFEATENQNKLCNFDRYMFFSQIHEINSELNYPLPSKGGEFWDFTYLKDLLDIGSRQEDYINSFTARMLLLLESKPIYNQDLYNKAINKVVGKYFTDYSSHDKDFLPLILMNDIFRYWYTLTLNFEYRRDDNDDKNTKNWKRLKLKFARLLTCFSMIACLYEPTVTPEYIQECINSTPLERLKKNSIKSTSLGKTYDKICLLYEWFLSLKHEEESWWEEDANKTLAYKKADEFHELVIKSFLGELSTYCPELKRKSDFF